MKRAKITRFKVFLISSLLVLLPSLCLAQETYIWIDGDMKRIGPEKEKPSDKGSPALDKDLRQGSDKDASEQEKAFEKSEELEEQQRAKKGMEQRAEEIEKARREYEEAKKSEKYYHIRDKNIESRRSRYLWKQSQRRLETAKQRLEELEKTQ
jgi:HD superfamily phosphohydrolase